MGWRDHLPIHPAAALFPRMFDDDLRELGEDIRTNGLLSPIILSGEAGALLDGRNRLDAIELLGMELEFVRPKRGPLRGKIVGIHSDDFENKTPNSWAVQRMYDFETDPYDLVISANLHRRHLSGDQKRELIAMVLKAKPEASNRQIAKQVKADHKTVAAVRSEKVATGEIPQLEKTTGADGKQRKARAKKKPKPDSSLDKLFEGAVLGRVIESAEVSVEDRKTEMARLDEPGETVVDEVDKRVIRVMETIMRHVEGLTADDTERFFKDISEALRMTIFARSEAGRQALQDISENLNQNERLANEPT